MPDMVVGKTIVMPCMRRGLVKYPDETILVTQASLEQLAQTAYGIPVTIEHPGIKIDSETLSEIPVVGRVSKMFYKPEDDLWYAEFVVDKQEAVDLLKDGWGVSTAWYGQDYAEGGSYNALDYDRELVTARYEHLAIVQNPRYEMATDPIFLNSKTVKTCVPKQSQHTITVNSKSSAFGGLKMFAKIWRTTREEVKANENEELVLELEHGQVPLSKIVEELKSYKPEKAEAAKRMLADDEEVEINGESMKVSELKKHYQEYLASKKNEAKCAEDEAAKKHEDEDEAAKKHEDEDEAAKKHEDEAAMKHEDEDRKDHKKGDIIWSGSLESLEEHFGRELRNGEVVRYEGFPAKVEIVGSQASLKENSKEDSKARFNSLKSAYENGVNIKIEDQFVSTRERVEMGKSRYGSSK